MTTCDSNLAAPHPLRTASTFFYRRPSLAVYLLLVPPLLWFGTVYLGSLFALLAQSFYAIDEYTATIVRRVTLATYAQLFTQPANLDIVLRTTQMAIAVTIVAAVMAFPLANFMARHARGRVKAFFYVAKEVRFLFGFAANVNAVGHTPLMFPDLDWFATSIRRHMKEAGL